jgi:hypothetical protein
MSLMTPPLPTHRGPTSNLPTRRSVVVRQSVTVSQSVGRKGRWAGRKMSRAAVAGRRCPREVGSSRLGGRAWRARWLRRCGRVTDLLMSLHESQGHAGRGLPFPCAVFNPLRCAQGPEEAHSHSLPRTQTSCSRAPISRRDMGARCGESRRRCHLGRTGS